MGGGAGQAAGPVSSLEKIFWAVLWYSQDTDNFLS
jgi:hypothetical protein